MSISIKLTDTQFAILSAAARREDRCLVIPKHLKGNSAQKVSSKLLAAGLVSEIKAKSGIPVWRRNEAADKSYALKLTTGGMKAVAVDDHSDASAASSALTARAIPAAGEADGLSIPGGPTVLATAPREGTKMARIVGLLQRDRGATLAELIVATDWLPHTTRAALTGLRKRGFVVTLDRSNKERGSTYSIARDQTCETAGAQTIEPLPAPAPHITKTRRSTKPKPIAHDAVCAAA
jgi:Protein of unknown function (DUF3489)